MADDNHVARTGTEDDATPWFLRGGGISGQTARAVDWSATPLGPTDTWPSTLKTTLATMFRARQPMFLWWGPQLIQFYNDGYLPSFGHGKHPRAMGQRGWECWQEIWPIIGPQIDDVMDRAIGSLNEDALVPILRNGKLEEVYWTYTYSPVFADDGAVAGTLVICTETTSRVLAERRMDMLHRLVGETSLAGDEAALSRLAFQVIGASRADIPWAALYERDGERRALSQVASAHLSAAEGATLTARIADLHDDARAPLGDHVLALDDAPIRPETADAAPVRQAYVAVAGPDDSSFLAFGLSPQLSFDDAYRRYLDQVRAHLHVASVRVAEASRRAAVERERRNLLEQAPVPTAVIVGPRHVFELANALFCQMVGRPSLVGQAYLEAFPELVDTPLSGILDRVYREGVPFAAKEYMAPLDEGRGVEERFFTFNLEPVRDERGEVYGMMAVAVEITEQVTARRALEKANTEREALLKSLQSANRAKDEFLAMLGHELRNPLSPIVTALRLMKAEGRASREQDIIERQVNHLIRLVDDLLDVAKIARGKVELRREVIDPAGVVHKAVEMAADLLEQRNHHLTLDCPRGRFLCDVDPVRLAQVIANLLTNAARYTERGGSIAVALAQVGAEITITVTDNGMGIDPEMVPRLFQLFEQGHRSTDRAEGGLGIGLSLVKNLVALHGGSVSAHSDGVGRGSRFTVRLPAVTAAHKRAAELTGRSEQPNATQSIRVLVVDDNADSADLLRELLEMNGHQVAVAYEPFEALAIASTFAPQVAVIDIGLPVMDGYELATRLRNNTASSRCHLVALTGYGQDHDRERSATLGFAKHLVKPVDPDVLLEVVQQLAMDSSKGVDAMPRGR